MNDTIANHRTLCCSWFLRSFLHRNCGRCLLSEKWSDTSIYSHLWPWNTSADRHLVHLSGHSFRPLWTTGVFNWPVGRAILKWNVAAGRANQLSLKQEERKMKGRRKKQKRESYSYVNDWIVNSAECYTNYHSYSGLRLRVSIWCYVCYTQCQTKRKNKKRKDKNISPLRKKGGGSSWIGATKLEVEFSRSSRPSGERFHGMRSLERNKGRVDQRLDRVAKVRFENRGNPATIWDRDRANICIYTEW